MANRMMGEAVARLPDDRALTLRFDHEAFFAAEQLTEIPVNKLLQQAGKGLTSAARALLFGGLRFHHPDLTAQDATDLMVEHPLPVMQAMRDALAAAFPAAVAAAEGKQGARPPVAAASTGPAKSKRRSKPG